MNARALPELWTSATLREIVEIKYGKGLPARKRSAEGRYPVYGSNGIVGHHTSTLTRGPTIVIGRKGSVGEVHFSEEPCWPIDTTYFIDEFPAGMERRFLFFLLRHEQLATLDKSTAVPGINRDDIYRLSVPIPPLKTQERIVSKVRTLLSSVSLAKARLTEASMFAKQFRQSVLARAFRGELTQRDSNDEPAERLLEGIRKERRKRWEGELTAIGKDPRRYKYKEPGPADSDQLPRLPDGWAWSRVDWVADVRLGQQRSPKNRPNKYPRKYLRAANIIDGTLDLSDVKRMDFRPGEFDVYRLRSGDVLLSEGSGSPYEVGKCAVWDERISDCCIQNTVIRVRSEHISPQYLLYVFMYARYKGDFAKMAKGIEIAHLGAERLAAYKIPLARKNEQFRIIERIDSLLAMAKILERPMETALRNTEQLEHSLLSCAFRGELVLQDPNDEPASVLLERIRAQRAATGKRGRFQAQLELASPANTSS